MYFVLIEKDEEMNEYLITRKTGNCTITFETVFISKYDLEDYSVSECAAAILGVYESSIIKAKRIN